MMDAIKAYSGWTEAKAPTFWNHAFEGDGDQAVFGVLDHSGGAELALALTPTNVFSGAPGGFEASNSRDGVGSTNNFDGQIAAAYAPPSTTGFDYATKTPGVAGFCPADSFKFWSLFADAWGVGDPAHESGGNHIMNIMVRGGDIQFAMEMSAHVASGVDGWHFFGNGIIGLQQAGDTNGYCRVYQNNGPYYTDTMNADFFNAAETAVLRGEGYWESLFLGGSHCSASPWNASEIAIADDVASEGGVIPTNGIKGKLNPEVAYYSSPSIPQKNTIASEHVHAIGGLVCGWDNSNPAWP
jgi:hypothetical protein